MARRIAKEPRRSRPRQPRALAQRKLATDCIRPDDLPERVRGGIPEERSAPAPDEIRMLRGMQAQRAPGTINLREIKEWVGREAQKRIIMELQMRAKVPQRELARMLGVDPKTLRSRLKGASLA